MGLLGRTRTFLGLHSFSASVDQHGAGFRAKHWNKTAVPARINRLGLVLPDIEFLRGQLLRWQIAMLIFPPEYRSQTTAVGTANLTDNAIDLFIRNIRRHPIHSCLPVQRLAQRSLFQTPIAERGEHRQSPGIERVKCALNFIDAPEAQ